MRKMLSLSLYLRGLLGLVLLALLMLSLLEEVVDRRKRCAVLR